MLGGRDAVEVLGDPNRRRVEENKREGSRRLEENCQVVFKSGIKGKYQKDSPLHSNHLRISPSMARDFGRQTPG